MTDMPASLAAHDVVDRYEVVRSHIDDAARAAGRSPEEVRLLPVSKTVPPEALVADWEALQARSESAGRGECQWLAENRVQEAAAKATHFAEYFATAATGPHPQWVVIGPLQTNKAGQLVEFASEFQALDRPKVAAALQRRLAAAERNLNVLIQVNSSEEPQKAGVALDAVEGFVEQFGPDGDYPNLRLRGFMTMAMKSDGTPAGEASVRRCFEKVRVLRDELVAKCPDGVTLDELSMGMSGDYELAIAEGATTVRVGQAIFGARPPAV